MSGSPAAGALAPADFERRIAGLGPFEAAPHIAVACSGGPDSLALALLTDEWARTASGRVTALVVDHGMRPESADEAATVCGWLSALGITATVLTWRGPRPGSDRQAAARRIRYTLMRQWCAERGVLHLLLAHHRQDQAETMLLRLARGSGVEGLAAMAPVGETAELRVLRPLLGVRRETLLAMLEERGQPWVDDPSNRDPAFGRVRIRSLLPALAVEGMTPDRLAATARRMARARAALEEAATALLARAAEIYPEGYALVAAPILLDAPAETGLRALARLLACIGGGEHVPRLERLERLYAWLRAGAGGGRTLAGCHILRRGGRILLCREAAAIEPPRAARDGLIWDGRFRVSARRKLPDGVVVGALGNDGWRELASDRRKSVRDGLPAAVRPVLPALRDLDGVLAVPHLNYRRKLPKNENAAAVAIDFSPARVLGGAAFAVGAEFA